MKTLTSVLLAAALALPTLAAHAAGEPVKKATSAQKTASAKKQKPAAKNTAKARAQTRKGVPNRTARAVEANTPVQTPTQRLSEAELAIAQLIHTGTIKCELGANVTVMADPNTPGFFNVTAGKQRYYMHPVESRTGAIRLEDNRAGAMWLQLGNKSMLMNQKQGSRVADECQTDEQRVFASQMQNQPNLLGN